jgi:hypothetical protein
VRCSCPPPFSPGGHLARRPRPEHRDRRVDRGRPHPAAAVAHRAGRRHSLGHHGPLGHSRQQPLGQYPCGAPSTTTPTSAGSRSQPKCGPDTSLAPAAGNKESSSAPRSPAPPSSDTRRADHHPSAAGHPANRRLRPAAKWLRSAGRRVPTRHKALPLKPSHPRSAACRWLRSNGKGQSSPDRAADTIVTANVWWLAGYRHPRHHQPSGCAAAGVRQPAPLLAGRGRRVTRSW